MIIEKAAKASTRTSSLTSLSNSAKSSRGFTLIELLVVVALIGLISIFALPSVTNFFKLSLNSTTREMASLVKEAYNSTVMTGKVHRLVYDLKENQFWVESGPGTILLDTNESREAEKRRKRFAQTNEQPEPTAFALERSVTRKKLSLPRGVTFEDVLTEQSPEPITEGAAYTHFFPHGITEQTLIHLKDSSGHHISLIISPLIGRTRLVERYIKPEEAYATD
jgi:prepilin-type N-terminal cleavage/methylation domain-containing protein